MVFRSSLAFILALASFASCTTTYHFAEFLVPSEAYIPADLYRMGLINRGAASSSAAAIYINNVPYDYINGLPQMAAENTLKALEMEAKTLARFEMVDLGYHPATRDETQFLESALSSEAIDSLCTAHQLDGVISIAGAELQIRTTGSVNVATVIDQFGNSVRVPEFQSDQIVTYVIAWRMYDGASGKEIDNYQDSYQRYFSETTFSPYDSTIIGLSDKRLVDVAFLASDDYFNRISPHWKKGQRIYYRGGSAELLKIYENLEASNDWQAAADGWIKLTRINSSNIQYKASFNMALASEMLGKPRIAKEWLEAAMKVKNTAQAKKYMAIINKQIVIKDVVDRQLGNLN